MRSDFDTDYEWYEQCAIHGVTFYQLELASLILTSRTDDKRALEAYKWLFIAHALENPSAMELIIFLNRSMTAEQVLEAESMVQSWLDDRNTEYAASKTDDWGQELHTFFKKWELQHSQTTKQKAPRGLSCCGNNCGNSTSVGH